MVARFSSRFDDDNYCIPESDFYQGHMDNGSKAEREVYGSDNGWFDMCGELVLDPPAAVVARGYPYTKRNPKLLPGGKRAVPLVANAGLWLADLRAEIWGMIVTPHLIDVLRQGRLEGSDYSSVTRSLARLLQSCAEDLEQRTEWPGTADYVRRIGGYLGIWLDVCNDLGVT